MKQQLPDSDDGIAAVSVTRTDDLNSDDAPGRKPRKPRRYRIGNIVGPPTKENLAKAIEHADEDTDNPNRLVGARMMFLNGIKPREICRLLRIRPGYLKPFWAAWVAEKEAYAQKVQSDAWTIGQKVIERNVVPVVEEDLAIGSDIREVLKKTLESVSKSLASGKIPDAKELERLAKVFKSCSDVTHRMIGLTNKVQKTTVTQNNINLPPGLTAGVARPLDVPSTVLPSKQ